MPMLNFIDESFMARITVSGSNTEMWAIVDTGLAFTVLETTDCATCGASLVSPGANLNLSTAAAVTDSGTTVSGKLNNPQTDYTGTTGTAQVCIRKDNASDNACEANMQVHFAKAVPTANPYANAYIGMALGEGQDHWGTTPTADDLIINKVASGTSKKFAIGLATDDGNGLDYAQTLSFMDLGGYAAKTGGITTGSKGTIQFDSNDYYWKTTLNGIRFGGKLSGSYALNNAKVSIDTGLQCLYVPSDTYEFVYNSLLDYSTGYYVTADGETVVDCGDTQYMQNIQLLVNDHWVEIAQNDYLNVITTEYNSVQRSTGACRLCLKQSWDRDWHIGTSALMGYYTEFDFDTKQVSFTRLSSGSKLEVISGARPERVLGLNWTTVILLSSAIAFVMFIFVTLCMAVYCDFNLFARLFGGAKASRKSSSSKLEDSSEISLEHLEQLVEKALLRKQGLSAGGGDNLLTINALV